MRPSGFRGGLAACGAFVEGATAGLDMSLDVGMVGAANATCLTADGGLTVLHYPG